MSRILILSMLIVIGCPAFAQTPPTKTEIATYTGLHLAAYDGDLEGIRRLSKSGSNIDIRDGAGRTPAHIAAYASNNKALRALAEAGADMNALEHQSYDMVTIAAVADDPELMSLAIELGNRADLVTSPYEGTALIAAAHLGHDEVVRRLIAAGAPLDHVNNLGWTALIEAVILGDGRANHISVVKALVEAGADTTISDRSSVTPLAHAQSRGYSEIAEIIGASASR